MNRKKANELIEEVIANPQRKIEMLMELKKLSINKKSLKL